VRKEKWVLTYDKGGKNCGYMIRNMEEIFSSILRGVRSLPVTKATTTDKDVKRMYILRI
jgi:hypothetical protein